MDDNAHSNLIFISIETEDLKLLQKLYSDGIFFEHDIEDSNYYLFRYACTFGKLKSAQWMCSTFHLERKQDKNPFALAFINASVKGRLEVCEWLYLTFHLSKKDLEANYNQNEMLYWACEEDHFHMVDFLFSVVGLTERDIADVIDKISEDKREKLLRYSNPFGANVKPVKNNI
jgi:hypothetical protein